MTNLVPSTNVFLIAVNVNTLSNVWRLLLQCYKYIAGLVVEAYEGAQTDISKLGEHTKYNYNAFF